ncbi:MAG: ABC transporter substrate-binding protein [Rhizobiales bacterium]|nr:ABC transporter substrate-binding protein [Hyphomicrobiales bacterium]
MSTDTVKGLISMGVQGVMDAVGPVFERTSRHRLVLSFNTSKMLVQQLRGGAETDVVIGTREGLDGLASEGLIAAGSSIALAHSIVGMAVRKGAPKADISTPEAFKRAVLAARAIGYSEPAGGGASGVHFEKLIHQLGIADAVRPKSKHPPVGTHTADMLLTGEVDLAVQQIAELIYVQGIELVGPFPAELQLVTTFAGGVHAKARDPDATKALLAFLRTPLAAEAFRAQGLEPA